ncbi:hypothetical protein D3C84_1199050 [compost metagenome]
MRLSIWSWAASSSALILARWTSYMGVQIIGARAFTVMPWRAHSWARVRVQASTAPLEAA